MDHKCRKIYSIDARPLEQPDDLYKRVCFEGNSTERMLANLRRIDPDQVSKIVSFDSDARDVDPELISEAPDLCFIDGEHTKASALSDFDFCLRVCSPNAIIYFHDDNIVYPALGEILRSLAERQVRHAAFKLQLITFAIALGDSATIDNELQKEIVVDGHRFVRRMQMRRLVISLLPGPLLPAARGVKRLFRKMSISSDRVPSGASSLSGSRRQ